MHPEEFTELRYTVAGGVARITLDRPDQLNAFTSRLYRELRWAVRRAGADEGIDVVVVTGAGRAFATGGDLKECLARLEDPDPLAMSAFLDDVPWADMRHCPKMLVAAINGLCLAGGLIIAACCDVSVAAESARFGLTEGRAGIADAVAPALLAGRLPEPKLKYLLLTGKLIGAAEAERIGLITEVVPDERLWTRVDEVVEELRSTSPVSRALFKEYVNRLTPLPPTHGVSPALTSLEAREGLRAFAEGRAPDWGAAGDET